MKRLFIPDNFFYKKISRKNFIKSCAACLGGIALSGILPGRVFAADISKGRAGKNVSTAHDLTAVKGDDPYRITVKAVDALGGMGKFVNKGDRVVIKPNMAWDRSPEQAGNTNPLVMAALVDMAFQAGAGRINVFDRTCNDEKRCYDNSRIASTVKDRGANVYFVDDWNFVKARFPYKSPMEDWPVYRDALECDVFINVPIAKHHGLTDLTLSMKNLMGVCGGTRGLIHNNIGLKLAHLTDFIKPELTVVDAYRVLLRNGPSGGNLADAEKRKTVIAATDSVLADSYAADLMGRDPLSISYIKEAVKMNLGSHDLRNSDILTLTT